MLVKSILDMSMEVIRALLAWQKVGANHRDFSNASATQATHAIVTMATCILQVVIWFDGAGLARGIDSKGDAPLPGRVGLCCDNLIAVEALGVDDTVRVGVSGILGEACTSEEGEANTHLAHVQQSQLDPTVPTA